MTGLFVFGLGYSARAVVERIRPGLEAVWGTTRDPEKLNEMEALGVTPILFDGALAEQRRDLHVSPLDGLSDAYVLVSIAPEEHGDPVLSHHRTDLAAARPKSIVYLSTVGVYGDHAGAWVDETSECRPVSRRSRQRVEAEAAWRKFAEETGIPVAIVRLAGIYGPGRGPFEKIRRGTARRIIKPGQIFNRIHVEDIGTIVETAFDKRADGIFNGSDDEPAPPEEGLAYAAKLLGLPPPPEIPFERAELTPMARSFYGESKRVRNDRIKRELGMRLAYPTYREGLKAILDVEKVGGHIAAPNCHNPVGQTLQKRRMVSVVRFAELYLLIAATLHWMTILVVGLRARLERPLRPLPSNASGVTILRPVCGIENHLEATLSSGFRQTHPRYEILFCVASDRDPVIPLVRRLIATHPNVPAKLLVGDDRISINPKLNNLVKGWEAASHDWIVMADSNVLMPPDYIERLLAHWGPHTGIVSSPPVGAAPDGIWAELECGFLNTYQARWQLAAGAFGLGFAHGKTMLWRRDILESAGGIRALAAKPAEDAAGTQIVRDRGLAVSLVPRPFPQPLGKRRFIEVWRRQLRWARLRRVSFGLYFYPEIFSGGFLPLCVAGALVAVGAIPLSLALLFAGLWYGAEALLAAALGWPLSWRSLALWFARDIMLPGLWFAAISGSGFDWRGNEMHVRRARRATQDLQLAEE